MPDLRLLLWAGLAVLGWVLWLTWRPNANTTGLPLCYVLSLAVIHFVGAWVSILPSSPSENFAFVTLGFRECVAGTLAFAAGVLCMERLLRRAGSNGSVRAVRPTSLHQHGVYPTLSSFQPPQGRARPTIGSECELPPMRRTDPISNPGLPL